MVPKINVYLSDELADAVKDAGLPVSTVCQRALEHAVARVTAIRETVLTNIGALRDDLDHPSNRFSRFTQRARTVLALGIDDATSTGVPIGTDHLLAALLAERGNLALSILKTMEIEPEAVLRALSVDPQNAATPSEAVTEPEFDETAQEALRLAGTESISLGHNYVGCEHLLLGLVAEPDGRGGRILRSMGADLRLTRHAVAAALAGYNHLQVNAAAKASAAPGSSAAGGATTVAALTAALNQQLAPIVARLDRLEQRLAD